jgi:type I restriction enzyme S subunit
MGGSSMVEEKLSEIPKDWATATISELIDNNGVFIDGDWVESKDQDPSGGVRLVQLADIGDGVYRNKSNRFLTLEKAVQLHCTFLKNDDVLIARMPNPLGRACLFPGDPKPCVTVVDVCIVRLNSNCANNRWLMYAINSPAFRFDISSLQSGSTRKRISRGNLAKLKLPIPPPPEQRAIVSKIEQLFSDLDNGIDNFKKAQEQLRIYRQAVLKKAFEGDLTKKWREEQIELPSAEELLQQVKEERGKHCQKQLDGWKLAVEKWEKSGKEGKKPTKPKEPVELPPLTGENLNKLLELPERWKWVKTSKIIFPINNGYTPKANYLSQDKGEIPFIKVYNLNFDGTLNFKLNPTFTIKEIHNNDLKRSICCPDDVLINIVGPPLGKVSIVPNIFPEWNINQAIVLFRPNNFINSKYLSYYHQNPVTIAWLDNTSKATAGQFNVKVSTCREIPFPFCSIQEQHQIVKEIEIRLSVCDKMETTIAESLQKAESLRQSILKKAFEGKLLSENELEEVRNAPDWEPAEELLERIKAEKNND